MTSETPSFDLVVPTSGRPSLGRLLEALSGARGPAPGRIVVVDDRRRAREPLPGAERAGRLADRIDVVRGPGRGPAAARNVGWLRSRAPWIVFCDDDVVPAADWLERLGADLDGVDDRVGAVQGRVDVPLPEHRRATDWERNVAGLESASWITADMALRRVALERVGGFDERFPRPYREDSDLALRLRRAGWELRRGSRRVLHPVGEAGPLKSVRLQAGNSDDVLMRSLHGPRWRTDAGAPVGRRAVHLAVTAAAAISVAAALRGRRRAAAIGGLAWLGGTAQFAWRRIAPGPRNPSEIASLVLSSALIPPLATAWSLHGIGRAVLASTGRRRSPLAAGQARDGVVADEAPEAVVLDRDGTLVHDVPYNGDPDKVMPLDGAAEALARLRGAGVRLAVVSNQSGIGRGIVSREQVEAVNRRIDELLGPFEAWLYCPHAPEDGCDCRKPSPRLVADAARRLGASPQRCAVIGDIGSDVEAAIAAGARPVLVPNRKTRPEEIAAAPERAGSLGDAVDLLLAGGRR